MKNRAADTHRDGAQPPARAVVGQQALGEHGVKIQQRVAVKPDLVGLLDQQLYGGLVV